MPGVARRDTSSKTPSIPTTGLVVEADVPAHNGGFQYLASFGYPFNAGGELVVGVGLLGATEVQAVGEGHGQSTDAREVPVGLGDGGHPALLRVQVAVTPPTIGGRSKA